MTCASIYGQFENAFLTLFLKDSLSVFIGSKYPLFKLHKKCRIISNLRLIKEIVIDGKPDISHSFSATSRDPSGIGSSQWKHLL